MKFKIAAITAATVWASGSSGFAGLVDMTWTPGGYTATATASPPTAEYGTVASTVTPNTMAATLTANPANGTLGALYLDGNPTGPTPLVSDTVRLAYDVQVNTQPAVATVQPKNLNLSLMGGPASAGTAGIMLGMNIYSTHPVGGGAWAFRFAMAPTSAGEGVFAMRSGDNTTLMAFGSYTVGTQYSLALDADYGTGTLDAYINGVLALNNYPFNSLGAGTRTTEVFIHLNGETGTANSVSFENFQVTAPVPEPSTVLAGALLALPLGLQGFRVLRNRKPSA